jgi:nitroreductase
LTKTQYDVYLECGKKRIFAGSLDWPGWCRQGLNEDEALAALLDYGPRYASILKGTRLGFVAPKALSQLNVVERFPGTATTDFGAPGVPPAVDRDRSCDAATLKRFEKILRAGWRAFDEVVQAARGKKLATGPRGGGRSLDGIVEHVIGAEVGYLAAVGWKSPKAATNATQLVADREAILEALKASAAGQIPERGPRGGVRWSARYFVRRTAWHVIAHVWEIQRRVSR